MTEKTEKTFEPITSQEQFDARIKNRLAREREKWEKESGTEDLKAQLQAKDKELEETRAEHHRERAQRAVLDHLERVGVADEGRQNRILKHIDLGEVSVDDKSSVANALASVSRDLPELLTYRRGAGSRGSSKPVLEPEKPLTREELEKMDPQEVNSDWDRVRAFLSGERG